MNANRSNQTRTVANNQERASQQPSAESGNNESQYFNLHVDLVGFANDVREVIPNGRKQDRFLAVRINALRGQVNEPNYTKFDLRISGSEAGELFEQLIDVSAQKNRKILVACRLGDIYVDPYMGDEFDADGHATGRKVPRAVIKGRLLLVKSIRIDGELWYQRPQADDDTGDVQTASAESQGGGGDDGIGTGCDDQPEGGGQRAQGSEPDSKPSARSETSPRVPSGRVARVPSAPQRSARAGGYQQASAR